MKNTVGIVGSVTELSNDQSMASVGAILNYAKNNIRVEQFGTNCEALTVVSEVLKTFHMLAILKPLMDLAD